MTTVNRPHPPPLTHRQRIALVLIILIVWAATTITFAAGQVRF